MNLIRPFGNNLLVEPVPRTSALELGQGSLCEYGTVVAIGEGARMVKVGDVIGFLVWGIQKLEVEDKTYYFIPESSDFILGFIE